MTELRTTTRERSPDAGLAATLLHELGNALTDVAILAVDGAGELTFVSQMAVELMESLSCDFHDLLYAGLPAPRASGTQVELSAAGDRTYLTVRDVSGGTVRLWVRVFPRRVRGINDGALVRFGVDDPLVDDDGEQLLRFADDLARARADEREARRQLEIERARSAELKAELQRVSQRGASSPSRKERRRDTSALAEPTTLSSSSTELNFHGIVTRHPKMLDLISVVKSVGPRDATVLIQGESGVGKELVARALHEESTRRRRPFVAVNCATLVTTLAESQLFGHVKGAFTGAVKDHDGFFVQANGGTLFLDEVAELTPELQSKLLRVLQEGVVTPLGGTGQTRVDVRLVAASHAALEVEVAEGRFRADLMYRVSVIPVEVPPLRERRDDIPSLLRHFIARLNERGPSRVSSVSPSVVRVLRGYDWPGNVRELQNAIEHAFALVSDGRISIEHLPRTLRQSAGHAEGADEVAAAPAAAEDAISEEQAIKEALAAADGKVTDAARALGMSRTSFWRKRRQYGL